MTPDRLKTLWPDCFRRGLIRLVTQGGYDHRNYRHKGSEAVIEAQRERRRRELELRRRAGNGAQYALGA